MPFSIARIGCLLAVGAAITTALAACGDDAPRGVAGDPVPQTQEASSRQGPDVVVDPPDRQTSVRLDKEVRVSVATGILQSVRVYHSESPDRIVLGHMAPDSHSWASAEPLDNHVTYVVDAKALSSNGTATTSATSFTTLYVTRLVTSMSPADGETVGIGMPISLRFNTQVPRSNQKQLLSHIKVTTTPAVVGDWHWFTSSVAHWRPRDFWPPGTKVTVDARLHGVEAGGGAWGFGDFTSSFTIGEKHLSIVDVGTHQMQVFQNDQPIATWPISAGRPTLPTLGGTLYVPYKLQSVKMDSLTLGIPRNSPDGYYDTVYWNTAISVNGFYVHAAPWSEAQQGVDNVSHGCVNLNTANATTFFNFSRVGDVVIVKNTPRVADYGDGEGDWQVDWSQWPNSGGALPTPPPTANTPGGV